jgi:Secretion system C-terminal sorting domain
LANLCPTRDGAIVYEARGLYNLVNNDPGWFNDNCGEWIDSTNKDTCKQCGAKRAHFGGGNPVTSNEISKQRYKLYPNPNDGNFILQQYIEDTEMVAVEVSDVTGRVIYKDEKFFNNQKMPIQMNDLSPGVYLFKVTDHQNKKYNFKFLVAK